MPELIKTLMNGFMDHRESERLLKLNHKISSRRHTEINHELEEEDEVSLVYAQMAAMREELVELQLLNEILMELLKDKLQLSEKDINQVMSRLVWQHEKDEQRRRNLSDHAPVAEYDQQEVEIEATDSDDPDMDEDPLSELQAAANRRGEGGIIPKSIEEMSCPHCSMGLDDYYEECPWCYGPIRWVS